MKQQGLSSLRFGYLISEDDLHEVVEYSKSRRPYTKRTTSDMNSKSSDNIQAPDISISMQVDEPAEDTEMSSETEIDNFHPSSCSSPLSSSQVLDDMVEPNELGTSTNMNESSCHSPTSSEHANVPEKAEDIPKIGCLKSEDTCPELQLQLNKLREFYSSSVNPLRKCSAFSPSTLSKFLERVKCFLNFCRVKHTERKLDLTLVDDVDIVQSYTTYQIEERKLNISTVVRTITALINICKFVHRDSEDVESCVHLVHLKNVQRQLSQRQQSYNLAAKAGLCPDNKTPSFMFHHLLETIKILKEKVDTCRGSPGHTRILHDFVMVALYVTTMCGRSKELRTLQLFNESEEGKEFKFNWRQKCNVFVVSAGLDKKFTLYENDFKNLKTHGPSKFELDNSMWLIPYVKEYVRKRQDLLNGKSHSFMFMTATGLAFNSSTFTSYVSAIFEREVNIRAGTTKLRHALVTHVLSLPESESLRLRESLAELMRHSLKHQQKTYCDISRQDRTSLSRDLLNRSVEMAAKQSAGDEGNKDADDVDGGGKESSERSCSDDDTVCIGDIVALVDNVSTCAEDASIFVGRVIRVIENEALLMEFRCVDSRKNRYRSVVGSSWWESVDSLVHPIDIVYDRTNELYELRSSPADIYRIVYP